MEALDAAAQESDQQGFDVVLLDGNFPPSKKVNGEAAQRVISELRARRIGAPVIAFSTKDFAAYGIVDDGVIEMGKENLRDLPAILDEL